MGNLIIFTKVMLVSSIMSALVSPTSLNTPGILLLPVLPGERNCCHAGLLQIARGGAVGLLLRVCTPVISPNRVAFSPHETHRGQNQIFTEAHILKSTSPPSFVPCRGRCEAFLAQSNLAQQGERGREEVKSRLRETQG